MAAGAQQAAVAGTKANPVAVRVNGVAIAESRVLDEMEALYPSNTAHGGMRAERLQELRAKALEELVIQELAWQRAEKTKSVVPLAEVKAEYLRIRAKYGAKKFDESLKASNTSVAEYQKILQRRMTLGRMYQQKVTLAARVGPKALRDYYEKNRQKFERPERVHARLILAAVEAGAKPEDERKAKEKIEMVYRELRAGKDFAQLAQKYSEDFYRVKGGDVGWMHKGSLDPEFEKMAFRQPIGSVSEPFRTSYGYNLLKVEAREPARRMKFEEVRAKLKAELEQKKVLELRRVWVEELKKGAQIQTAGAAEGPIASH